MNPIGGYFELELRQGEEYHKNAIRLNTARNALELILKVKHFKKVYIPYYTCDAVLEPFHKLQVDYEYYSIDENFEPLFDNTKMKSNEGFLYNNYFGLKDIFISHLAANCKNLIIDNSHAFYAIPEPGIPTFYSCRKFFGVPDGAYLYLEEVLESDFPIDYSIERITHLLKRIEFGAEAGYNDFKANENSLMGLPILQMSKLTKALLCNIDYEFARKKRIENYLMLYEHLSQYNELKIKLDNDSVPMVYPFVTNNTNLRQKLIEHKIFVASYWPNVKNWCNADCLEYKYASKLIPFAIDQRIDKSKIDVLIKTIE